MLRFPTYEWRRWTRQLLVLLCCAALSIYFSHHTLYGRYGFEARETLMTRSELLEFEITSLKAVRAKLSQDVALLVPQTPDADLVEEMARDMLGFAHPDDIIVASP